MKDKDDFCLQGTLRTFLLLNLINKKSVTPEKYCKSSAFLIKLGEIEFYIRRFPIIPNIWITTGCEELPKIVVQLQKSTVRNIIIGADRLLCNEWFDDIYYFKEGFAVVKRKCENRLFENWIDLSGKLLSSTWYTHADSFRNGLARFKDINGLWNFIRYDGSLLNPIGEYDIVDDFYENGYATVSKNKKWNLVDKDGNYFSSTWYLSFNQFKHGFAVIQRVEDKKYNWIRMDGSLLSQKWYDACIDFYIYKDDKGDSKPVSMCKINGIFRFIDVNGNLIDKSILL